MITYLSLVAYVLLVDVNNENEHFEKPDWLGEEVTGDIRYYNSQLSKHSFRNWTVFGKLYKVSDAMKLWFAFTRPHIGRSDKAISAARD